MAWSVVSNQYLYKNGGGGGVAIMGDSGYVVVFLLDPYCMFLEGYILRNIIFVGILDCSFFFEDHIFVEIFLISR